ncbi:MAG: hypothetical protein LBH09_00015, partial [Peptococcaceae bacterium]|nr:hypothetical protein [Peptococcaceae bacterium]
AKNEKKDKGNAKTSRLKLVLVGLVCVVLFGVIVYSAIKLIPGLRKNPETLDASGEETEAPKEKKEKYNVKFDPGDAKTIYNVEEKEGEPRYEVTVLSARELSSAEKTEYGLTKEKGRLGQVEMDVRLIDLDYEWDLYNRRIADAKGNWLDEIKSIYDESALYKGLVDTQTLIVRLPADKAKDEKVSLSIFTSTWNNKKKADGKCEVAVNPPPAPPRPGSVQPVRNVDTDYGNWTGNTYTSSQLDMKITLPDDWNTQLSAANNGGGDKRSMEGAAVRSDGKATLQLSVDKQVGNLSEEDQIEFFKGILKNAVGEFNIGEPYRQTIAGKEYLGMTYTHVGANYYIYFLKEGDHLVEVAIHFPVSEADQAAKFLENLQAIN